MTYLIFNIAIKVYICRLKLFWHTWWSSGYFNIKRKENPIILRVKGLQLQYLITKVIVEQFSKSSVKNKILRDLS